MYAQKNVEGRVAGVRCHHHMSREYGHRFYAQHNQLQVEPVDSLSSPPNHVALGRRTALAYYSAGEHHTFSSVLQVEEHPSDLQGLQVAF
mgnify:CR=1 FL=1